MDKRVCVFIRWMEFDIKRNSQADSIESVTILLKQQMSKKRA